MSEGIHDDDYELRKHEDNVWRQIIEASEINEREYISGRRPAKDYREISELFTILERVNVVELKKLEHLQHDMILCILQFLLKPYWDKEGREGLQ